MLSTDFRNAVLFASPLSCQISHKYGLSICVSTGHHGDSVMPTFLESVDEGTEYTYIALWLGPLFTKSSSGQFVKTEAEHHITLAYLPGMHHELKCNIRWSLDDALHGWLDGRLDPLNRPIQLMPARKCVLLDEINEYGDTPEVSIWELGVQEINQKLLHGAIQMKTPVASEDVSVQKASELEQELIVKMWHRDRGRLNQALKIESESTCWSQGATVTDMIPIGLSDSKVARESEISSLLHYLRELLLFKHGVYHVEPRKEVFVLDAKSWHVSPQESENGIVAVQAVDPFWSRVLQTRLNDGKAIWT